ncbi:uncharacterized protein LOC131230709 [Magnolia sinica]|uniref:uncharacterized protein LOC131230709 n=1 Tax=Magnolia sinica TaxID=86752 RepID=UPI00265A1372|nr:uncharacterized protein LOC131230709 [Magnolia sinica]
MGKTSPREEMGKTSPNLLLVLSALVARCAKHATRLSKKLSSNGEQSNSKIAPRSPLASSKQLLTTLSNKAIVPFLHKKKIAEEKSEGSSSEDGWLWQREILMGEKCQPLDFSGVIYYDREGKQLSEIPLRSPRCGSPLHQSFSFPTTLVEKGGNY